jgi:methionyl-tRNA formyltransferase
LAVPSLKSLHADADIDLTLVVTQPDRSAGRGRKLTPPPVKVAAESLGIDMMQPETLRDEAAVAQIASTQPDLLVVVAYGEILRRPVLEMAPLGCINVHPSLLPKYRGASPIPAAILNGDDQTGISIIRLVRRLDAGPILAQRAVDISSRDTTATLSERLAQVAAEMLPSVALDYAAGVLEPQPQDDATATYTREWTTADAEIDWQVSALQLDRLIRAANPWPVAWTTLNGDRLRILDALPVDSPADAPDSGVATLDGRRVLAGTADGALQIVTIQPPGKRPMPASDWWRGLRADSIVFGTTVVSETTSQNLQS